MLVLVVDDGSTDRTAEIALQSGADYVVRHRKNRGLARAFMTGLTTALALGADVIVNTDADHQYPGSYIPDLVRPILSGAADLVVGDRQSAQNIHFSPVKRLLEQAGSWLVRVLSRTDVPDAASGFRAYSRFAALRLQVHNDYSYTLETLIQAGRTGMSVAHVPIHTNPPLRPSRLHSGMHSFLWRQSGVIVRSYVLYQPLQSFVLLGSPFVLAGILLIARFLYFYLVNESGIGRHVQSVIIGGTLAVVGMLLLVLGLLGDALRANRQIIQECEMRLRESDCLTSGMPSGLYGDRVVHRADHDDEQET